MKITFIKPNMGLVNGKPYSDRGKMEPLTFAILAGITPPEHETLLYDDRFEAIPFDEPTDLVAINTEIYTAKRAYEIADQFRIRGVKVVLGGYHTTMLPEESLQHADAVVIGDAEGAWERLLDDLTRGHNHPVYRGTTTGNGQIRGVKTDWSIFKGKKYLPVTLTQLSRGCNKACDFCATATIYRKSIRCRPVGEVVRELRDKPSRNIFFVDDNIIGDLELAKELFRAIRPLHIKWVGQSTVEFARDPELTDLLVESGCAGLVVGFESLDPVHLAHMNKAWNLEWEGNGRLENYDPLVERMKKAGLQIWAAFALGYDNETAKSIRNTCDWALSHKFSFAAFNILTPYPATPLYRRMEAEGRLLYHKWWLHDEYRFGHAVFRPKNMEPEELAQACLESRLRFNSTYQILRRATERDTNCKNLWSLITFFAYNPLLRDEIVKKHGMKLGYHGMERNRGIFHRTPNASNRSVVTAGNRMMSQPKAEKRARFPESPLSGRTSPAAPNHPIRILLVLPDARIHRLKLGPWTISFREAPLTLTTLAGLIPPEISARVTIVDESVGTKIPFDEEFDLVGISCITGTAPRAYEIAETFMKKNRTVVLGGFHVTLLPEEAKQHAHSVVLGFAERTWPQLLRDFERGELKPAYEAQVGRIANLPIPRRDLQKRFAYMAPNTIFATRGCKGKCDFCAIPAARVKWQTRPIPDVIGEIKHMKSKRVVFNDVSIAEDPEYAKQLFEAMIPLKRKWGGLATTRILQDPEMLDLMHKSGCIYLLIGFESFENRSLSNINKGFNKAEQYRSLVKELHDRGIIIQGCFIFGFDEDRLNVFEATVDWVNLLKIDIPRYAIYTPYPCTQAFQRLKDENRILHENWAYYDTQHVVFQPKNMSVRQLDDGLKWAYKKTFQIPSILTRSLGSGKNVPITLLGNLAYKIYVRRIHRESIRIPMEAPVATVPRISQTSHTATYATPQ